VACLFRSIDILVLNNNTFSSVHHPASIALELKLHDWRKGLRQANHHLFAVDYSCVCIPRRTITEYMLTSFESSPIGLVMFTPEDKQPFVVVSEAKPSDEKWPVAVKWLEQTIDVWEGGVTVEP